MTFNQNRVKYAGLLREQLPIRAGVPGSAVPVIPAAGRRG